MMRRAKTWRVIEEAPSVLEEQDRGLGDTVLRWIELLGEIRGVTQ